MHFQTQQQTDERFEIGGRSFPAFSGLGEHANNIIYACLPWAGPIPLGTYYIFDR